MSKNGRRWMNHPTGPDVTTRLPEIGNIEHWTGTHLIGVSGTSYQVEKVLDVNNVHVVAEVAGGLIAKVWSLPERSDRYEWDRRFRQLPEAKNLSRCQIIGPLDLLVLSDPYRGYILEGKRGHHPLAEIIEGSGDTPSDWYQKASLRARLILGARLAQIVEEWKNIGLSKWGWNPQDILASFGQSHYSLWFTDSESFVTSAQPLCTLPGDTDYLAPELKLGHRQPDSQTDAFSLGVMIFRLLFGTYSFSASESERQGSLPEAIAFDSHAPSPLDKVTTERLNRLFDRCLVQGGLKRLLRPEVREWYEGCLLAAEKTVECHHCRGSFYPGALLEKANKYYCPFCESLIPEPAILCFFNATLIERPQLYYKRADLLDKALVIDASPRKVLGRHVIDHPNETERRKHLARIRLVKGGIEVENLQDQSIIAYSAGASRPRLIKAQEVGKITIGSRVYFERPGANHATRGFRVVRSKEMYL